MKISIVLQIFAVIAAGEALTCLECEDKVDCIGESVECPDDKGSCAQGVEQSILGDTVIITKYRRCLNHTDACNISMSMSARDISFLLTRKCCQGDDCNSCPFQVPVRNTTKSGHVCNSCFTEGRFPCTPNDPLPCTGNETQCMEFYGRGAKPGSNTTTYYFAGCGSPEVCKYGLGLVEGGSLEDGYYMKCTERLIANSD